MLVHECNANRLKALIPYKGRRFVALQVGEYLLGVLLIGDEYIKISKNGRDVLVADSAGGFRVEYVEGRTDTDFALQEEFRCLLVRPSTKL